MFMYKVNLFSFIIYNNKKPDKLIYNTKKPDCVKCELKK